MKENDDDGHEGRKRRRLDVTNRQTATRNNATAMEEDATHTNCDGGEDIGDNNCLNTTMNKPMTMKKARKIDTEVKEDDDGEPLGDSKR